MRTPNRHERAEQTHVRAERLHTTAARFWDAKGNPEVAEHERRLAQQNHDGAAVERLRGQMDRYGSA